MQSFLIQYLLSLFDNRVSFQYFYMKILLRWFYCSFWDGMIFFDTMSQKLYYLMYLGQRRGLKPEICSECLR